MVGSWDPGKETEAGQVDFQDIYNTASKGRYREGHTPTYVLPFLTSWCPARSHVLSDMMFVQPQKWGANVKKRLAAQGQEEVLNSVFHNQEAGRDLPPLSLPKALVEQGWLRKWEPYQLVPWSG